MEFEIKIVSNSEDKNVLDHYEVGRGRALLREVRHMLKDMKFVDNKNIRYKDLHSKCVYATSSFTVKVPEDVAEKVPHFEALDFIEVKVPPGSLGLFLTLTAKPITYKKHGKYFWNSSYTYLDYIVVSSEVDEVSLLKAWVSVGCPLEWDPRKEKND